MNMIDDTKSSKYLLERKETEDCESKDGNAIHDLLQCCHTNQSSLWNAFANLFHPRRSGPFDAIKNMNENNAKHLEREEDGVPIPTADDSQAVQQQSLVLLTPEENEKLGKTIQLLRERFKQANKTERSDDNGIRNKEEGEPASSFLLELVTAAAEVEMDAITGSDTTARGYNLDDEDPETAIKSIMQQAKRKQDILERQRQHVERVKFLVLEHPTLLRPLDACLNSINTFIPTRSDSSDENRPSIQQDCFPILTILLGTGDVSSTMQFLSESIYRDAKQSLHEENNLCNLIKCSLHFAVVREFLTIRGAGKEAKMKLAMKELIKFDQDGLMIDPATKAMSLAFLAHCKEESRKNAGNDENHLLDKCFLTWHSSQAPSLLLSLSLCVQEILFPKFSEESSPAPSMCVLPGLALDESSYNSLCSPYLGSNTPSWLFAVVCAMPMHNNIKAGHAWHQLYSTHDQGFNISTLKYSLTGYKGPTLIIIEGFDKHNKTNHVFGAYASQPWENKGLPEFYGDSNSFLFQLEPKFRVSRAKGLGSSGRRAIPNYQYFHCDNRVTPTPSTLSDTEAKKHVTGLGLGGSRQRPRFFISESLEHCYFGPRDATFEDSQQGEGANCLLLDALWDLHSVQIWGVGGDSALRALNHHRGIEDAQLQKARQVDKAAFLDDFRSGLIETKMFAFHEDVRNRFGDCLLSCEDEEHDVGN